MLRMLRQIGDLRRAYRTVKGTIDSNKRQERVLDYADLEVSALRALQFPHVQQYYQARWRKFPN